MASMDVTTTVRPRARASVGETVAAHFAKCPMGQLSRLRSWRWSLQQPAARARCSRWKKAETRDGAVAGVGQRVAMRVSLLQFGADAAEVERVLGRPTSTTLLDALGTHRSLVYADETVRTEVTLTANRVTAVALGSLANR